MLVGVIISALVFAWDNAKRIRARKFLDEDGNRVYEIYGPLFFGSTTAFMDKFDALTDTDKIIIDFKESRVADMSAIEALKKLTEQYKNYNKKVVLRHLSADCVRLLENAGGFIEVNIEEDPVYNVMPE